MNWIGKLVRLKRRQKQRIFNRAYRQALKLMKKEFKAERERHLQAEKELEKYYRKDVDTEAKKPGRKFRNSITLNFCWKEERWNWIPKLCF